jgi:hypothetical protein
VICWSSCCFLAIGMIAFAEDDSHATISDEVAAPAFGFQVQVDQDGNRMDRDRTTLRKSKETFLKSALLSPLTKSRVRLAHPD